MVIDPNNQNNQQNPNQPQTMGLGMGQPAPKGSGRFTNLQKYVTANQGAGQQIGQRIGTQVGNQAQQVREGIAQAKTGFQQQVDPEKQRIGQSQALTQEALQNTQQFVNDPTKLGQFQQLREGQTAQINPLQLQQQQSQAAQAQQMAANTASEQGRFQLLKGAFANPRYTTGLGRLDQLFLQSSPALKQLQEGSKAVTQGLGGEIGAAREFSQQELANLQNQAAQAQQGIMSTVGKEDDPTTPEDESAGEFGTYSKDIFGRINTQQKALDEQYQGILNRFNVSNQGPGDIQQNPAGDMGTHTATDLNEFFQNLTPEQQKLVGLDKDQFAFNIFPEEFKGFLRQKQLGNQERARFFNEDEYNRYKSLGQLMGVNTQQNLNTDEQALLGKGLGEYSLAAIPQLQQEQQAREAALWSGGYLNDMPDLMRGYEVARNLSPTIDIGNLQQFRDMPSSIYQPALQQYFKEKNIPTTWNQPMGQTFNLQNIPNLEVLMQNRPAFSNFDPNELGQRLKDTQYNWRAGQLVDRAANAGMRTTLGGQKLSAEELYNRYQTFKNKGLI